MTTVETGPSERAKLKIFMSYARSDMAFTDRLVAMLESHGLQCLIDRRDLPYGEEWKRELNDFIHSADAVVFIVSLRSLASSWCKWEIGEIQEHSKRLIPAVLENVPIDQMPKLISDRQLMPFYDVWNHAAGVELPGFASRVETLATSVLSDWSWLKEHTRISEMARRWYDRGKPDALLVRAVDLDEAETWAAHRPRLSPSLSDQIRVYLAASRKGESERLRHERAQIEQINRQQEEIEREQLVTQHEQAQTRVAQTRSKWLLGLVSVLVLAGLAAAGVQSRQTSVREADVFASAAEIAFEQSSCDRALRLALAGLPGPGALPWSYRSPLLEGQLARFAAVCPLQQLIEGHEGAIHDAVFDRDGRRVLTASWDKTVRLWKAETGETIQRFPAISGEGHDQAVESVAWSPDESRIVTASWDATARIWDPETGRLVATIRGHKDKLETAVFSPDGKRVLTASHDHTARIWDVATTNEIGRCDGHTDMLHAARFSPDGKSIVTASWDGTARLWTVDANGRCNPLLTLLPNGETKSHGAAVFDAAFSADGHRVLSGSDDKTARLWDVATGSLLMTFDKLHGKGVHGVGFSPDPGGRLIATAAGDWNIRIWDADTGNLIRTLIGHVHSSHTVRFSPDGSSVLSSSQDGTARIWNWRKGDPDVVYQHTDHAHLRMARLSPDEKIVATVSGDGKARLFDAATGVSLGELPHGANALNDCRFTPDGRQLATAASDGTVHIWDVAMRRSVRTLSTGWPAQALAITPDGARLAALQVEGHLRIWELATGVELPLPSEVATTDFADIQFSRDGKLALAAGMHGKAILWDMASARILQAIDASTAPLWSAVLDPSETLILTASRDRRARAWEVSTGAEKKSFPAHDEPVRDAQFISDGSRIVTASWDRTARISGIDKRAPVIELRGHQDTLRSGSFSPGSGARVLTTSEDKTARLWDAETGVEIRRYNGFSGAVATAQFERDGRRVLIAARDDTARIWSLDPILDIAPGDRRDWVCRNVLRSPGSQSFRAAEMKDQLLQGYEHLRNPCKPVDRITILRQWLADWWGGISGLRLAA